MNTTTTCADTCCRVCDRLLKRTCREIKCLYANSDTCKQDEMTCRKFRPIEGNDITNERKVGMNDSPGIEKAAAAIAYILGQIRDRPEVGWYLGEFTQSFHMLTEAHAAITNQTVETVREHFSPRNPFDPRANGAEEAADSNASRMSDVTAENLACDIAGVLMLKSERPRITRLVGMDVDGNKLVEWMRREIKDRIKSRLTEKSGAE